MEEKVGVFLGIFLLVSIGFASAGWFDWITGNTVDEPNTVIEIYVSFLKEDICPSMNDVQLCYEMADCYSKNTNVINRFKDVSVEEMKSSLVNFNEEPLFFYEEDIAESIALNGVASECKVYLDPYFEYLLEEDNSENNYINNERADSSDELISCVDTDSSNGYTKGEVQLFRNGEKYQVVYDSCNGNQVNEYVCDGSEVQEIQYECENGCNNSACISLIVQKDIDNYHFKKFGTSNCEEFDGCKNTEIGTYAKDTIDTRLEIYDFNEEINFDKFSNFVYDYSYNKMEFADWGVSVDSTTSNMVFYASDEKSSDTNSNTNSIAVWYSKDKIVLISKKGGIPLGDELVEYYIKLYPSEMSESDKDILFKHFEDSSEDEFKEDSSYSEDNLNEEENNEEQTSSSCQLGYRKDGKYCDEGNKIVSQKVAESTCDNNFECESNLCIDSECVSSGLWQKIINFFKNIFG